MMKRHCEDILSLNPNYNLQSTSHHIRNKVDSRLTNLFLYFQIRQSIYYTSISPLNIFILFSKYTWFITQNCKIVEVFRKKVKRFWQLYAKYEYSVISWYFTILPLAVSSGFYAVFVQINDKQIVEYISLKNESQLLSKMYVKTSFCHKLLSVGIMFIYSIQRTTERTFSVLHEC